MAVSISIHALCEEGDHKALEEQRRREISIHALCEEGDADLDAGIKELEAISIHALCEEGDLYPFDVGCRHPDFYPRPLRGGRRSFLPKSS